VKTISVRDLQKNVKESVNDSQKDRVIITRHGKPTAVLVGVEGRDWEDVVLQTDPSFWRLIRTRRKQDTLSLEKLKEELQKT
jgi:prevent-host-death family protein